MFRAARWRLVLLNVGVFSLLLLVLGVAVYGFFSASIYQNVDEQLKTQWQSVLQLLPRAQFSVTSLFIGDETQNNTLRLDQYPAVVASPSGQYEFSTRCFAESLTGFPCSSDTQTPLSPDAIHSALDHDFDLRTVWFDGEPQRIITFATPGPNGGVLNIVQISHSATGEEGALSQLRLLLLVGGLLGVLFTGLVSIFLANRALVPIREAFARQRRFTADASHELRTPLALIRANAEMLGRHDIDPSDAELVDEIVAETDHLNRLVSDLLTLARADSDGQKLPVKPVDFRELVADVHEDLSLIAESHGIASTVQLNGPVTVQGDEVRLRQLLVILLDNAIKYTDPGGKVDVSLARVDNRARLVIKDTGIGIPTKDLDHIFERFYRVDRAREHESGGTGLGLAIASWIVQAHHGAIKAESDLGEGSRFQVDLPLS